MKKYLLLAASLLVIVSCTDVPEPMETVVAEPVRTAHIFGKGLPEEDLVPDLMNVRVTEQVAADLEAHTGEDGWVNLPYVRKFNTRGVTKMRRLFPYAGKFEARTREAGLHLWYVVTTDGGQPVTRAADDMNAMPGVEEVELNPRIHIVGDPVVTGYAEEEPPTRAGNTRYPFDDPRLPAQWHYYNNGTVMGSESGCDINVFSVWRGYTVGNSKVIVCVVDGGIDYSHEDLAANMWNNPEKSGANKYGYNFVNNSYQITPESHGTHVAGTIAAVNNNGIGVCGIAGGNAVTREKGVKLMSCQIFMGKDSGNGAAAIKWGADHGAVISQNSWGYEGISETPTTLKSAVDYFIKNAGVDENGKQTGPMKGGVVIFAAGNENVDYSGNGYGPIVNVASVGANYRQAYYSCYGHWVDIAAPGGDVRAGNQILSTLPGNKYGYMQGTSMACPHVSGVAALIASRFGTTGYTPDGLIRKLTSNVTNIRSFNPNFAMGTGLVNAYRAIAPAGGKAPKTPTDLSVGEVKGNTVHVSVTVPQDEDDGVPTALVFYYNKQDFTRISENLMYAKIYVSDENPGETLTGFFSGMDFESEYYVRCAAEDALGNLSGLTGPVRVTTGPNSAPVITELNHPETVLRAYQTLSFNYDVVDPDGHNYALDLTPPAGLKPAGEPPVVTGIVLDTTVRNQPKVVITGKEIPTGKYTAKLTITDYYGAVAEKLMDFEVLENQKPYVGKQMPDMLFSSRETGTSELHCDEFFKDDDGEILTYSFSFSNENVVNLTARDGVFYLTPMNMGVSSLTVTGTDVRGASVSQTFRVVVRDGTKELEVYPNPVRTDLFFRTGEQKKLEIRVVNASGATWFGGTLDASPFDPAVVDMRDAFPGAYTVIVESDGKTSTFNVVKL